MEDITSIIQKRLQVLRSGCQHASGGICSFKGRCPCEVQAEVLGYIQSLIPAEYRRLTIGQFDGFSPYGGKVLSDDVVSDAVRTITEYCWGDPDLVISESMTNSMITELMKRSVIDDRRDRGTCLVIHGDQPLHGGRRIPVGKTMLAAVALKEVIYRRFFSGHAADTYEWVSYIAMKHRAMRLSDEDSIIDYQIRDWLVVDNILPEERGSDASKSFLVSRLDAIFAERLEAKLPTILVFQYDLDRVANLHWQIGAAMYEIVNDPKNYKIKLNAMRSDV